MLRVSIEELSALDTVLHFMTVKELLESAMRGLVDTEEPTLQQKEKSDLCWKVTKTL